jgi:succinate dehydrogenase flavin-adding protein (antitoxin of CptAB toxin-antitoxin module)
MRELDAVLEGFLEQAGAALDARDIERFEAILELPDPKLYAYLLGRDEHDDPDIARLFERIRRSVRSAP